MATTARLGIDIVGTDKTRAAFMSAQRSLGAFTRTIAFATGALAGIAGGALLKNVVQSFIQINKHVEPVKTSFQQIDRAWQQFALNVGKGGLNDALINFNERIATMIIRLKGLSDIIGTFLGGSIDALTFTFEAAGRLAAFLSDNIRGLGSSFTTALGNIMNPLNVVKKAFGEINAQYGPEFVEGLKSMGLNTDALTQSLSTNHAELAKLPPTFDELAKSLKKADDPMEKMVMRGQQLWLDTLTPLEKYKSGVRELNVLQANGALIQDTYARRLAQLKEEFSGTGKTVKDEFNAMEEAGSAFGSSFSSALQGLTDGTFSLRDALGGLLSDLTSLFSNQALSLLGGGGSGGGFLGKLFGNFGGLYASGGTLGAGKWGIAGENGPEPIVGPATVVPNRGMGGNVVQIIDQRKNAPAVEQRQGAGGISQFIIRDAVNDVIGSGQANKAMRGQYGMVPQKARR